MPKQRVGRPGPYLRHLDLLRERIPDATKFPYTLPAIRDLTRLSFHPKVTYLIGENGSGKSTLLEAIAVALRLNPEGGSRNFNFATYRSHSPLDEALRLVKTAATPADSYFLRAESYYNVASEIERLDKDPPSGRWSLHPDDDSLEDGNPPPGPRLRKIVKSYGGVSLHEQSHGESFYALFLDRFGDNGLYLMDEPEAALSPMRQLAFLKVLHGYLQRGGQFVIATHSPIIMAYPHARIYQLDDGIREVKYEDTEHYGITRDFLLNPEQSMSILMGREA